MARIAHIPPGVIYRKMPYLKLMAMLKCLELEDADRAAEQRQAKLESNMASFAEKFRRGQL